MIEVVRAPAFTTVQDGGREGFRRSGVPPGGAMDRLSLQAGNALLGNPWTAAALECALTGGSFRFQLSAELVLTGAAASVTLSGAPVARGLVVAASAGDILTIERVIEGRFLYVCVAGGIDVPIAAGGRGTYLPAGFGGFQGRRLEHGDVLPIGRQPGPSRAGLELPATADVLGAADAIGVLPGPQAAMLSAADWQALLAAELRVSTQSDRAGFRLEAASFSGAYPAGDRSEPACTGAVQLTPDGELIVLMPDGPTVGGYPKIAVVATAELPRIAQTPVGGRVRLRLIESRDARAALEAQSAAIRSAQALTRPGTPP